MKKELKNLVEQLPNDYIFKNRLVNPDGRYLKYNYFLLYSITFAVAEAFKTQKEAIAYLEGMLQHTNKH